MTMVLPERRAPTKITVQQEIYENDEQDQRQDNLSDKAERWRKREQRNDPPGDTKHQNQNQQIDQQSDHGIYSTPGRAPGRSVTVSGRGWHKDERITLGHRTRDQQARGVCDVVRKADLHGDAIAKLLLDRHAQADVIKVFPPLIISLP